jgi:sortase A
MRRIRSTPQPFVILSAGLLAVGLWQTGEGCWIYAKARLAQVLLQRAWSQTLAGGVQVKPWPWADTWPLARLRVPSQNIDLIVLNGAYNRTLAFGPAFAESSALPGTAGTTILTGHRDTHFTFLGRLKEMDEIVVETPDGNRIRYRVHELRIVDARTDSIHLADGGEQLILLTCYPFDAVSSGSPLRYLVRAIRAPSPLENRPP